MKLTLIRPRFKSVWESLALGYIASYLTKHYDRELCLEYFDGYFDSDENIIAGCVDSDFVGFSCTSPQIRHALTLVQEIRQQNPTVITVFGGHHPSSLPEQTLAHPQVDVVVTGEGEAGMLRVLQEEAPRNMLTTSTTRIYHEPPIQNLDELPFPDREFIDQNRTLALTEKNDGERIASVLSGRGCPYRCVFCTGDRDVFGSRVRKRTVDNVLDEIETLVNEWRVEFIKFADTELNSRLFWVREFCQQKLLRNLTVPWGANVHAANMDECTLYHMRLAGCREIWVGVESGSPRILKEMGKGITVEMIENVFRWAKQCGVRTRAYFMTGFPSETREDFEMTLRLAKRIDADVYGMTILCPFPGTALYSDEFKDIDWSKTDEYTNDFWHTKHFTNEELKQNQAEFMDKFKDRLCFRQKNIKKL